MPAVSGSSDGNMFAPHVPNIQTLVHSAVAVGLYTEWTRKGRGLSHLKDGRNKGGGVWG